MKFNLIDTIKQVGVGAIQEHALKIMFGKVQSVNPLVVKVGNNWTLTEEFLVVDIPLDIGEDVVVIQYATGNKYLVLSTIEKVYNTSTNLGGVVNTYQPEIGSWKNFGTFKITHGAGNHLCVAGSMYETTNCCVADPKIIPYGSFIKINGVIYHTEPVASGVSGRQIRILTNPSGDVRASGTYRAQVYIGVDD